MKKLTVIILLILLLGLLVTTAGAAPLPENKNVVVTEFPVAVIDRFGEATMKYMRVSVWVTTS